jgi:hypothetical protein
MSYERNFQSCANLVQSMLESNPLVTEYNGKNSTDTEWYCRDDRYRTHKNTQNTKTPLHGTQIRIEYGRRAIK